MGFPNDGISRRELLRTAAAGGAAGALAGPGAALARRRPAKKHVAVLGGGMAGLAAAHELIERGFSVTVYERRALGGKARSLPVPHTATGGRRPLPGEHGFRFFPGFYHHVPDTMRRIPFPGNANGVHDNMKAAEGGKFLRSGDRPDALLFGVGPDPQQALTVDGLQRNLNQLLDRDGIQPAELEYFTQRLMVFFTSCDERRYGQWENVSWWDFLAAETKSKDYQHVLAAGLTRNLVAAKETVASTRTIGNMAEAFIYTIMNRGNDGALDRVLNAPTNEAWIHPWVKLLRKLGVRFSVGSEIVSLQTAGGRVVSAGARDRHGHRHRIDADYFVCAMPVERARRLWNPKVLALDPSLESMNDLFYDWMNGIQFFLKRKVEITKGHITFVDSPWSLTALTQGQFWDRRDFAKDYGDGTAVDCLSVDISNWTAPGILYGKTAKHCTRKQVANEVWAQIKQHHTAGDLLPDDILHSWSLDPGISWVPSRMRNRNEDPLLVNTVGSWDKRPQAATKIPNLFLAGDYVQTDIDLATMEGANESGRAAVNALLDVTGSKAERVQMYRLYDPPEFEGVKAADRELFKAGQPNALDLG
ncbi:MAG: hypothetical protein QOF76_4688 [Solirubrobacteraceae bacterium]|nr:hypothetical protein [Solirubrobacteraceae bacterium]